MRSDMPNEIVLTVRMELNQSYAGDDPVKDAERMVSRAIRDAVRLWPLHALGENGPPVGLENIRTQIEGLPYPWCATPGACLGKGNCYRDPNCGE